MTTRDDEEPAQYSTPAHWCPECGFELQVVLSLQSRLKALEAEKQSLDEENETINATVFGLAEKVSKLETALQKISSGDCCNLMSAEIIARGALEKQNTQTGGE